MSQIEHITESFHILDIIKIKLNEVLIRGIESINQETESELMDLKNKLEEMNFTTLSKLLESFLEKLSLLSQIPIPLTSKKEIAIEILRIIAVTRMLERIMNLESAKKTLKRED